MSNSFSIPYRREELDLGRCFKSGQVFRWAEVENGAWLGVDGANWYLLAPDHERGLLGVRSNTKEADLRLFLRLDWDTEKVNRELLLRGPELAPYMELMPGLRVLRPSDPNEVLFSFLCSANNHISRITGMVARLGDYGDPIGEFLGQPLHAFPDVETIAGIPEQELRDKGFGYRAATITHAARNLQSRGPAWLESLKEAPYQEAYRELLAIKGIGPKLADCICLFGLDKTEAAPIDTHIWQAMTRLYFPEWLGKPLTDTRYREASALFRDRFGELSGWAQQHLFFENVLNWRTRRRTGVAGLG